jgi:hypothetical protein
MTKTEIEYIIIERAEGLIEETLKPVVVHTFAGSDRILRQWATTAPNTGGYDKCDFILIFKDGYQYKGRFDLQKQHETGNELLKEHVESLQKHHAGMGNPWMGKEEYAKLVERYKKDGIYQFAVEFLAKYSLDDNPSRLKFYMQMTGRSDA